LSSFRAASKEDWSGARDSTFSKLRDITLPYEILYAMALRTDPPGAEENRQGNQINMSDISDYFNPDLKSVLPASNIQRD